MNVLEKNIKEVLKSRTEKEIRRLLTDVESSIISKARQDIEESLTWSQRGKIRSVSGLHIKSRPFLLTSPVIKLGGVRK